MVGTGGKALRFVHGRAVDLILMDVMLPDIDGLAVTREIRESEQQHQRGRVPIVAVTALTFEERDWLTAGTDGYLQKPFLPEQLLAMVHKLVPPPVADCEILVSPRYLFVRVHFETPDPPYVRRLDDPCRARRCRRVRNMSTRPVSFLDPMLLVRTNQLPSGGRVVVRNKARRLLRARDQGRTAAYRWARTTQ